MVIFGYDIRVYFLLFIIYAVIGWCMEVTCKLIQYKRFINRGFLIGPYCPIYGYGAILITILLKKIYRRSISIICNGNLLVYNIRVFNKLFYGKNI